ncbi:R8 protein [Coemansia sp. D1744]|nr:R8 protein [Coemansia sp. D1744]
MFYSQDLLCRRNGRFGAIWLLAMTNGRARWQSVSNRELAGINIRQTCADIVAPPVPLSLRLTSTLLVGLSLALARKLHHLYNDCHEMWTRVLATPWITSRQGFNPFISAVTTVSSSQTITLPAFTDLQYIDVPVDVLLSEFEPDNSSQSRMLKQLGWLEPDSSNQKHASKQLERVEKGRSGMAAYSHTVSWASLSIPDAMTRGDVLGDVSGAVVNVAPDDVDNQHSAISHIGDIDSSGDALDIGFDDASICFDTDGNLHFSSSPSLPDISADVHTEVLDCIQPSHDSRGDNWPRLGSGNPATKRSWDASSKDNAGSHNAIEPTAEHSAYMSAYRPRSPLPVLQPEVDLLEAIEDNVICNWNTRAKRQRTHRSHLCHDDLNTISGSETYERHVTALWGSSCYWDAEMQTRVASEHAKHARKRVHQCVTRAFRVFAVAPLHAALRQMLEPSPQSSPRCESPDDALGFSDGLPLGASDSELEQGRAASAGDVIQPVNEDELFNIDVDIPWLNPDVLDEMLRLHPPSRPSSVLPESSIGGSRQSTPGTRVLSLDLPSSEDGLDVQSFELAAHNLEPSAVADAHDLDSFLDVSAAAPRPTAVDDLPAVDLNHAAQCFCRFAMARMHDCNYDKISFDNLLVLPQHRTRRIAARAFADLLHVASRSVFSVRQHAPYTEITIVLE